MHQPQPMIESQISRFATIGYDLRDHTDSKANKGYKALRMQKKIPLALKNQSQVTAPKANVKVYMAD